jgi:hypothetical protein
MRLTISRIEKAIQSCLRRLSGRRYAQVANEPRWHAYSLQRLWITSRETVQEIASRTSVCKLMSNSPNNIYDGHDIDH